MDGWRGGGGVRAGASIHLLLRAAQVAALDSDLDHANLLVAFTGRGRQVDIERLASREAGDDRGGQRGSWSWSRSTRRADWPVQ